MGKNQHVVKTSSGDWGGKGEGNNKFDIALSFAVENRGYVTEVAKYLE